MVRNKQYVVLLVRIYQRELFAINRSYYYYLLTTCISPDHQKYESSNLEHVGQLLLARYYG